MASRPLSRLSQIAAHLSDSTSPTSEATSSLSSAAQHQLHSTPPPSIILICGWTAASQLQLTRYITRYSAIYPSALILFAECAFTDLLPWPITTNKTLERGFDELLKAIDDPQNSSANATEDDHRKAEPFGRYLQEKTNKGGILVHIFSNGGCCRFSVLANRYYSLRNKPLPVTALVIDSAPSQSTVYNKAFAVAQSLSLSWPARFAAMILLCVGIGMSWAWTMVSWQYEPVKRAAAILNEPSIVRRQAPRVHMYSREDRVVEWKGVEKHAEMARKRGYVVTLERFDGSQHVQHERADPDRYWSVIKKLWEASYHPQDVQANSEKS